MILTSDRESYLSGLGYLCSGMFAVWSIQFRDEPFHKRIC